MRIIKSTLLKHAFFIICFFTTQDAISQSQKFVPGYYINKTNDTLGGYLAIRDNQHPIFFDFKTDLQDKATEVRFDTCKALSAKNITYVNWFGKRKMSYVDRFTHELFYLDSFKIERIPLRLLHKGNPFSLYYFEDKFRHFFVEINGSITELIYSPRHLTDHEKILYRHMRNPPTYIMIPEYRLQFTSMMNNTLSDKQKNLLELTEFEKTSLTRLVKSLNKK